MDLISPLPEEILLQLGAYLEFRDFVHLSSASQKLRRIFAPRIFQGLILTDDETQALLVQDIASRYEKEVRHLSLIAPLSDKQKSSYFNDNARGLLQGRFLPNVTSIRVDMDVEGVDASSKVDIQRTYRRDALQIVGAGLPRPPCIRMLGEPWMAIAANCNVRTLYVDHLLPGTGEIFAHGPTVRLLTRLVKLHISIAAMSPSNWKHGFLHEMGNTFYRHLQHVSELEISFPKELDFEALLWADLAWQDEHMTRLRSFTLRKMFLGEGFCNLLERRASSLEKLHLDGCVCSPCNNLATYPSVFAGEWRTWANVFSFYRECEPILRELSITPRNAFDPGTVTPWIGLDDEEVRASTWHRTPEEYAGDVPQLLRENPRLHLFGYYEIMENEQDEVISDLHLLSMEKFRKGEDQKEYELLMDVVNRNARQYSAGQPHDQCDG